MRPPVYRSIARLGVRPDEPGAVAGPRPRGSRRPHTDANVAAVRRLIEQTPLTYAEIAARTGVACASICRWTRDGGWRRPPFAPRATDTVPRERASARLKRRTLAARLSALAERFIRELEDSASVDPDKLGEALELLKMAKLAARPRRRRRSASSPFVPAGSRNATTDVLESESSPFVPAQAGTQNDLRMRLKPLGPRLRRDERGERCGPTRSEVLEEPARVIADLRAAGVKIERAPREALADFIASRSTPRDYPELRPRGRRSKRNREHARMLERY